MAGISNTDGPLGPRIGVWGTFDVANFGDLLFPRIFEHEIGRRLPLAEVIPYSPFGYLHPVAMDGGRPADPLGLWEPSRRAQLASELDFVAVGGGEIVHFRDDVYGIYYGRTPEEMARHSPSGFFIEGLGADLETSCPVAWHSVGVPFAFSPEDAERVRKALASKAYVAVRDEVSRERLLATGTEREVHVVPDSAVLLPNLYPPEVLARRLRHLKMMGWYPEDRAPLVLQGSAWIRQHAGDVGQAVASVLGEIGNPPVVLIEIGPCHGDGEFLDGLAAHLPGPLHRMPGAVALEDVAAALAHARAYAGLSLHGVLTAVAFGVPAVILNLAGYSKLDGFARMAEQEDLLVTHADLLPDALRRAFAPPRAHAVSAVRSRLAARVETHFDALAGLAERAWEARAKRGTRPGVTALAGELSALRDRYGALLRAFEAQRSKLVEERLRYAEIVATLERKEPGRARDAAELAALRERVEVLEAGLARRDLERTAGLDEEAEIRLAEERAVRASLEVRGEQAAALVAAQDRLLGTRLLRGAAALQRGLARLRRRLR